MKAFLSLSCLLLVVSGNLSGLIAQSAEIPSTSAPAVQVLSNSPDGKFVVSREKADPGELGEARKRMSITTASGKVLYSWISALGASTILWSPDGHYLAVNDRPGEQGDLLRLFALDPASPAVTSIREPDGKKLLREEESRHGSFLSAVDQISFRAMDWREGKLWCQLAGTAHPKRQPTVHVPFHHLWVLGMHGTEPSVLEQEWTLTDPKERAVRDPYQ